MMTMVTTTEVATLTDVALFGKLAPIHGDTELTYRVTNRMLGEIAGFNEFNWLMLSRYPITGDFLSDRLNGNTVEFITSDYDDDGDPVIVYVTGENKVFTDPDTGVQYLRARTYWFNPINDEKSRYLTVLYVKHTSGEYFRV